MVTKEQIRICELKYGKETVERWVIEAATQYTQIKDLQVYCFLKQQQQRNHQWSIFKAFVVGGSIAVLWFNLSSLAFHLGVLIGTLGGL